MFTRIRSRRLLPLAALALSTLLVLGAAAALLLLQYLGRGHEVI